MKRLLTCVASALGVASVFAAGENLFQNPGFETWNEKLGIPLPQAWQWEFGTKAKRESFEIFEQAKGVKRSGEASLHIKDSSKSDENHVCWQQIAGRELAKCAGKILRFSIWVKQVSASAPKVVGIGIYCRGADGGSHSAAQFVDATGETNWQRLSVKLQAPEKIQFLRLNVFCANGWRSAAEAYFDDAELLALSKEGAFEEDRTESAKREIQTKPLKSESKMDAASEAYKKSYEREFVVENDGRVRPEIKNGSWFEKGHYVFQLGPWIYNRIDHWGPRANPLGVKHPAYEKPPCAEIFKLVGFDSAQISAAHTGPGLALYGIPRKADYAKEEAAIKSYYEGLGDVPLALDFAFGFHKSLPKDFAKELQQRNGEWHEFIPLCPEAPDGDRYYRDYMRGGTIAALKNKANVFVYELFNESSYNCQCVYSRKLFAKEMEKLFGSIRKANEAWGTVFANFDELAAVDNYQRHPKIWPDWCEHSARMYAAALKRHSELIRGIDKRPNVYFTEQTANGNLYSETGAGMDYRLIAETLDMLAIEGGWKYGSDSATGDTGNAMEAAASEKNIAYPFVADLARSLVKDAKPVMNHEHYNGRFELGMRVPSKKEDIVSSMWAEIMHGVSGSYFYCWDKRQWEYKNFEEAKANVIKPGYKSYSMLNPYNWPPEALDGFGIFVKELEPYRDAVLPCPRTGEASLAIFFSYPTLRMGYFGKESFKKKIFAWYGAALYGHYRLRFVFEEDLKAGLPKNVAALLAPCASYASQETVDGFAKFAARGGFVVADAKAFSMDERGNPRKAPSFKMERLDANDPASAGKVQALLEKRGVERVATLEGAKGDFESAEIHMIDRGDFKMLLVFNIGDVETKAGRLKVFAKDAGEFYLSDLAKKRLLPSKSGAKWTAKELAGEGVEIIVPAQERLLLTLERKAPAGVKIFSKADFAKSLERAKAENARRAAELEEKRAEKRAEEREARLYEGVDATKCLALDLRRAFNMAFADEIADDRRGGAFDQGNNDLAKMPLGRQILAGVPFEIVDPAKNGGKSMLTLFGKERDFFPKEALGVPLSGRARNIYFLHTMAWGAPKGAKVLSYRIHYADGSSVEIPVKSGMQIGGWWGTPELTDAKIALEISNAKTSKINLQCYRWKNPHPEKELKSLDAVSAEGEGVPALVAATAEE